MTLKIAQLSDCHLEADPETTYRGQDAGANLKAVWKKVGQWRPDIIFLTGDLSEDASPESYERLCDVVDTDVTTLALPGNHDDHLLMEQRFSMGPWKGPFEYERGSWLIVLLDSTLPGRIEGGFSSADLEQLHSVLSLSSKPNVLLALHHQPVPVKAPWIDRYALTGPDEFLEIAGSDPRVRCVVWGHIHHHFAAVRDGVLFLGAPSTAANTLAQTDRFSLDPAGPACRTLELDDSGNVIYGQLYGSAA
jgi:Icc protein